MNERIRELNLKAMSMVFDGNDPDGDVDKMYIPFEFTKKFAELIVRECADIVEETRWMVPPSQEQIARSIRQHFGVEE